MSATGRLLNAVRKLHEASAELQRYAPWPDDISPSNRSPYSCVASETIGARALSGTRITAPVIKALRRAAPDLEWRQTYSEAEVGAEFLENYGYVELFGPTGHFYSSQLRGYIGYWGPGLTYDWHNHEAEELYYTLAGRAVFSAKGAPNVMLKPGEVRCHGSYQPHLMITLDQPYLAYAVWRGSGMAGLPRMVAP